VKLCVSGPVIVAVILLISLQGSNTEYQPVTVEVTVAIKAPFRLYTL